MKHEATHQSDIILPVIKPTWSCRVTELFQIAKTAGTDGDDHLRVGSVSTYTIHLAGTEQLWQIVATDTHATWDE